MAIVDPEYAIRDEIRLRVWVTNILFVDVCCGWLLDEFLHRGWSGYLLLVGVAGLYFLGKFPKEARNAVALNPNFYWKYALTVSGIFFLAIAGVHLTWANHQGTRAAWISAIFSILLAVLCPLGAWIDPIRWRKHLLKSSIEPEQR